MSWFGKVKNALLKTRTNLSQVLGLSKLDDAWFDQLQDALILSDVHVRVAMEIVDRLKHDIKISGYEVEVMIQDKDDMKSAIDGGRMGDGVGIIDEMFDLSNDRRSFFSHKHVFVGVVRDQFGRLLQYVIHEDIVNPSDIIDFEVDPFLQRKLVKSVKGYLGGVFHVSQSIDVQLVLFGVVSDKEVSGKVDDGVEGVVSSRRVNVKVERDPKVVEDPVELI